MRARPGRSPGAPSISSSATTRSISSSRRPRSSAACAARRRAAWLAVGHVHNREAANLSAGRAVSAGEIAALFPDAPRLRRRRAHRARCARRARPCPRSPRSSRGVEAFSLVGGPACAPAPRPVVDGSRVPRAGAQLRLNPLYRPTGGRPRSPGRPSATGANTRPAPPTRDLRPDAGRSGCEASAHASACGGASSSTCRSAGDGPASSVGWGIVGFGWVAQDYMAPAIGRPATASSRWPIPTRRRAPRPRRDGARAYATAADLAGRPGGRGGLRRDAEPPPSPTPSRRSPAPARPCSARSRWRRPSRRPSAWRPPCRAAGILYGTAFDQRHHPAHRAMRDAIAAGRIGTVTRDPHRLCLLGRAATGRAARPRQLAHRSRQGRRRRPDRPRAARARPRRVPARRAARRRRRPHAAPRPGLRRRRRRGPGRRDRGPACSPPCTSPIIARRRCRAAGSRWSAPAAMLIADRHDGPGRRRHA